MFRYPGKIVGYLVVLALFPVLLAGLIACDVHQRTYTLKAKADNDLENQVLEITNITGRDWVDVTFTLNKLYNYTHDLVPASKTIKVPYEKFVDENGKAYTPLEGPVFHLLIFTKDEYWGLN